MSILLAWFSKKCHTILLPSLLPINWAISQSICREEKFKVHLTPKNVLCFIESPCYLKHLGEINFEFARILQFLCPFKVALEVLPDRLLGSLGQRLLMKSTQEPNTILWCLNQLTVLTSENGKQNSLFQHTKFCFIIISLSSLVSEFSFDSKDSKINLDQACPTTVNLL